MLWMQFLISLQCWVYLSYFCENSFLCEDFKMTKYQHSCDMIRLYLLKMRISLQFHVQTLMIFYNELQQHNWIRKMMQKDLMIDDDKWSEIVIIIKKMMIFLKIYNIKLDSELTKKKLQMMIAKIIIIFDKEIKSISQNWLHKTLMIMIQWLNNNERWRAQHQEWIHENKKMQSWHSVNLL